MASTSADTDARPHILLVSTGSRGDVQPFVALARGLTKAGYNVHLATHEVFREFVEKHSPSDVQFHALSGNPAEILASSAMRDAIYADDQMALLKAAGDEHEKMMKANMPLIWQAAESAQPVCIVGGITVQYECLSVGQKLNAPVVIASTVPAAPTSAFAPVGTTDTLPFGWMNKMFHEFSMGLMGLMMKSAINEFRTTQLHIGEMEGSVWGAAPQLHMFSEAVVPTPKDYPDTVHVTGYWVMSSDDDYTPDEELARYLADGDAPVYMGFGSMALRNPAEVVGMFSEALRTVGKRGIFCAGWSKSEGIGAHDNVLLIEGAPHDWLLPQCCAAIHHGGAGTTCASLRAGIPTIIFPFLIDQPFWAARVGKALLGPREFAHIREISADLIGQRLEEALADEIVENVREVGERLRAERGVERAVQCITEHIANHGTEVGPCEWKADGDEAECGACKNKFTLFRRRHHCRSCGGLFCGDCVLQKKLPNFSISVLVCARCTEARGLKQQKVRVVDDADAT